MQITTTAYLNQSEDIKVNLLQVDDSYTTIVTSEGNTLYICATEQQLDEILEIITKGFYDGVSYGDLLDEIVEKDRKIEELEEEIRQHKERIEYEKYEDKYDYIRDIERRCRR